MYNEIIPYLVLEYQTAEEKERSLLKQGLDGSIWTNKKLEIVSTLTEVAMKKILEKDTQPKM